MIIKWMRPGELLNLESDWINIEVKLDGKNYIPLTSIVIDKGNRGGNPNFSLAEVRINGTYICDLWEELRIRQFTTHDNI